MNTDLFFPEQAEAIERLVNSRGGIAWWKPGAGKTRIGIEWFDEMRAAYKNEFPCVCVVVLKRTAFLDFRKELMKLDYDCVVMEDELTPIASVEIAMLQKPTFLLISAAMLPKVWPTINADRRIKYAILDELHLYKNPKAQRSVAAQKVSLMKKSVGLSGSIMTKKNVEDIYGQLQAVQKHRYVAPNMTKFRDKFLNMRMEERKDGRKYPWKFPKPHAFRDIMTLCKDCVHVYEPPKDQRKVEIQVLSVPSTKEQDKAFYDLRKWMEVEFPDGRIKEYKSKLEVAIRIQQIANGWVLDDDRVVQRIKSNKLEAMADKIAEVVASGERCMVWCAFRQDVHEVDRYLFGKQIATVQFIGGEKFDAERWETGEAQVCVATESMGTSVNHFEQVPYAFYFSQNYKWLDLEQSMKRTDRKSSLHSTAFYYFMQVAGSLDASVFRNVNQAKDWEDRLINIGEELTQWQKAA